MTGDERKLIINGTPRPAGSFVSTLPLVFILSCSQKAHCVSKISSQKLEIIPIYIKAIDMESLKISISQYQFEIVWKWSQVFLVISMEPTTQ